jgi:restriction system protein
MAIPDYQAIMLPMLQVLGDRKTYLLRELVEIIAKKFSLSEEEKRLLLPSGKQAMFYNRVGWARTYLKKAGLIESPKKGLLCITNRGKEVLQENPARIDVEYLKRFDDFLSFRQLRHDKPIAVKPIGVEKDVPDETPEETLESAYQALKENLAGELLEMVKKCTPDFFEQLVVDLLVKMGYGGSRREAGQAIGRAGDEGIDGIIKEDRLGLDIIYVQAKRWENVVGRPEIQKFAGALQGQRARKGIFITTAFYTRDALDYVKNIETKIILIDGAQLTELMIDHGVGVTTEVIYELKRIDSDYFSEG